LGGKQLIFSSFGRTFPVARTDAVVLGAGIVGTSVALHLVKRGLSVALVDRRGPGEETSYGNAGIIEGATIYPPAFPKGFSELVSIALKRASGTNYHLAFLPQIAPWLLSYWLRVFYSDRLEKSVERANSRKRGVTRPFGNNLRSEPPSHC
jgi:glycine/D-amino acid oxidase-like deaminating enzyme